MSNTGKLGFRINFNTERKLTEEQKQQLKAIPTATLSDGMYKFNTLHSSIKPIFSPAKIVGPALTVKLRPADNLMLHKAISMAQQGDIIVVDTGSTVTYSVMGDLMATSAFSLGVEGIVIDGAIRDINDLQSAQYPIFTRAITPAVGDKEGPGEIGFPISCGGVVIMPGDIIVGDSDGVVVIPYDQLNTVIEGANKKLAYEKNRRIEIENGTIAKPDVDKKLKDAGVI